ncbi:MAG: DUF4261 domain-containing protein [Erythrobacter sp.]|nr:DUF4261 domain-containing protein [Erythrobacter sp.]NNC47717.1 DUF4261 domain-containing protein [Sphingomonas sp.]
MFTILYSRPKKFPAGPIRTLLEQHVPLYSWICGEDDDGTPECAFEYGRPILVAGRGNNDAVFVEIDLDHRPAKCLPPAPGGEWPMRVRVKRPTTDNDTLAERIGAVISSTMTFIDKEGVQLRFDDTDKWIGLEDTVRLTELVIGGERIADMIAGMTSARAAAPARPAAPEPIREAGRAASPGNGIASKIAGLPYADRRPRERSAILGFDTLVMASTEKTMAQTLSQQGDMADLVNFGTLPAFHDEQVSAQRLPTLALLFDTYAPLDHDQLGEVLGAFDPEGGWSVAAGEDIELSGRGGTIRLCHHEEALPAWMMELALDRSFGATPGAPMAQLRGHRSYLAITPDLDCTVASWHDVRETAKAMMCAFAVAARPQHAQNAYAVGAYNAATQSCFTGNYLDELVGALAQGEVSIKTFIWHAFPETAAGQVSLSSAGMLPFIGREVEVLDAPGSLEHVGEQLNNIERYLLINGPVMGDGDTIGDDVGDPLARAWHAMSDAHGRDEPVPVLRFEIRGPDGRWRPRHDPPRGDAPLGAGGVKPAPVPAPEVAPARPVFGRRVGGFGKRGL